MLSSTFGNQAHYFKNLFYVSKMTRIAGLPQTASERAFDMFLKVRHVQSAQMLNLPRPKLENDKPAIRNAPATLQHPRLNRRDQRALRSVAGAATYLRSSAPRPSQRRERRPETIAGASQTPHAENNACFECES